jgi:serine/threonine-protein kinase
VKPEVFGDWLLLERLSKRSMTEVYRAIKLGDRAGRAYVVKRVPLGESSSGALAESLRRETSILRTEGLVGGPRFVEAGELGGLPYLVLELTEGTSLDRVLSLGPLAPDLALAIGRGIAVVLAALHERGVVHGDLSPENVLVDELGEIHLLDFGLAYREGSARDAPGGKPGYTSPDVALGKPARSVDDVYAWGVVVAEALLGRHLFHEIDLAEAGARSAALPSELDAQPSVVRALSLDAHLRPGAAELASRVSSSGTVDPAELGELARAVARRTETTTRTRAEPLSKPVVQLLRPVAQAEPAVEPARLVRESTETARAAPTPFNRFTVAALALGLVAALALGLVIGRRFPGRNRPASITFPPIPARVEVELDGSILLVPEPGKAIPLEPGRHKLTVQVGKREATDYEFVAAPGDHIVVMSINPPKAGLATEDDAPVPKDDRPGKKNNRSK